MLHVSRCYLLGKLDRMYYGNNKTTARNIGFDDSFIYDEIEKAPAYRSVKTRQFMHKEAYEAFKIWEEKEDKVKY